MRVDRTTHGNELRIAIRDELDASDVSSVRRLSHEAVHSGSSRVELDLSRLQLIDSSGAGAIIALFKRLCQQGRELCVTGLAGQPKLVFEILGLDRRFTSQSAA